MTLFLHINEVAGLYEVSNQGQVRNACTGRILKGRVKVYTEYKGENYLGHLSALLDKQEEGVA